MSIFKNIKFELLIFILIILSFSISYNFDLWFYNYFENLNESIKLNENLNSVYFVDFFKEITRLGSSSWYFIISIVGFVFFYFNRLKILDNNKKEKVSKFFITSFFYILIVGIITQIGKHIVGRPRPNYTDFENISDFNFFTLNSNFHSFPSGHSSTIFIICFIMIGAFPKLKYFFYLLASIIAFSRVVVGAHFFTDIVAGALLSLILYKVLNILLNKKFTEYKFTNLISKDNSELFYYILFLFIGCVFVTVSPSLDLYVSSFFYYERSQFAVQSYDIISILFRDIFLPLILIYSLVLPVVGRFVKIDKIFFGYKFSIREIFLLWGSQIICVLIFVNLILKKILWGRARPNDVIQFGGNNTFSPWYEISKACETNCSFVSGDASVGFSIILIYLITKNVVFFYASIVAGFMLGLVRIMAGGHFLSDIFFAGIFMVLLNILFFQLYKKYNAK